MIDKILEIYHKTDFNFQYFANPQDELSYLFDELKDEYRMKYAICKALEPKSILEIGIQCGYSAITFLSAVPNAKYLSINDVADSRNSNEGMRWAEKITKSFDATFIIAKDQEMTSLRGMEFDLVYLNGHQDGDRIFHRLEMVLPRTRWILIDGFFQSKENMLSSTYFIEKYRQFIEYEIIVSTYKGDLLIKTKDSVRNIHIHGDHYTDYSLRKEYDNIYFLQDCGGYDSFKKYRGKKLTDERLLAAFYLATPDRKMTILDLGCGRGELCYAMAQTGASVTGIDYSPSAISIAENAFSTSIGKDRLEFICDDFIQFNSDKKYDRVIATDFVEHIEKNQFDLVLQKVAGLLRQGGLFIIHTSPNALNYCTPSEEKREVARSIGTYLPKNPRSYYEDIMHVNEQTPDSLQNYLERYFPNVIVWVATPPEISGSLGKHFSREETMNARSIFAIASDSPLDPGHILNQLVQNPLDIKKLDAKISLDSFPKSVVADELFSIGITLENLSGDRWVSLQPNPVHLSYHWYDEHNECIVFDGIRTVILYPLLPGESRHFLMEVIAPKKSGNNILQVSLVQESCFWFETFVLNLPVSLMIKTKPNEK